jgi:hypothetical protein
VCLGDDNKENTKVFSNVKMNSNNQNLFSSEEREINSHTLEKEDCKGEKTDSFKIPNKKSNFTQATEGKNLFSSVRINLHKYLLIFIKNMYFTTNIFLCYLGNIFIFKNLKFLKYF